MSRADRASCSSASGPPVARRRSRPSTTTRGATDGTRFDDDMMSKWWGSEAAQRQRRLQSASPDAVCGVPNYTTGGYYLCTEYSCTVQYDEEHFSLMCAYYNLPGSGGWTWTRQMGAASHASHTPPSLHV